VAQKKAAQVRLSQTILKYLNLRVRISFIDLTGCECRFVGTIFVHTGIDPVKVGNVETVVIGHSKAPAQTFPRKCSRDSVAN
jgi:hypothetical protein